MEAIMPTTTTPVHTEEQAWQARQARIDAIIDECNRPFDEREKALIEACLRDVVADLAKPYPPKVQALIDEAVRLDALGQTS